MTVNQPAAWALRGHRVCECFHRQHCKRQECGGDTTSFPASTRTPLLVCHLFCHILFPRALERHRELLQSGECQECWGEHSPLHEQQNDLLGLLLFSLAETSSGTQFLVLVTESCS